MSHDTPEHEPEFDAFDLPTVPSHLQDRFPGDRLDYQPTEGPSLTPVQPAPLPGDRGYRLPGALRLGLLLAVLAQLVLATFAGAGATWLAASAFSHLAHLSRAAETPTDTPVPPTPTAMPIPTTTVSFPCSSAAPQDQDEESGAYLVHLCVATTPALPSVDIQSHVTYCETQEDWVTAPLDANGAQEIDFTVTPQCATPFTVTVTFTGMSAAGTELMGVATIPVN
jgi:hypothetical protein